MWFIVLFIALYHTYLVDNWNACEFGLNCFSATFGATKKQITDGRKQSKQW
jgi:hypothetical protein